MVKIYILPVSDYLQPPTQAVVWPPGCENYGVEQDILQWLGQSDLLVDEPAEADYHYLPVFFNRWYWNHDEDRTGRGEFNDAIQAAIVDGERTFTISEYDVLQMQPDVDLSGVTIFTANRMADNGSIDIPLLVYAHQLSYVAKKRYLACFIGSHTCGLRSWMLEALEGRPDCYITDRSHGIEDFVAIMQASHVALAPRGDGGQSFRFYEAMQAGTPPLYLSNLDARPFKRWIDWDSISLYLSSVEGLLDCLDSLDKEQLAWMGIRAQRAWYEQLQYGKWCWYLVKELEEK